MKAKINDRDLGSARGVNITLPEGVTCKSWMWRDDDGRHIDGWRIEPMSRACIRELGEALIAAAQEHAADCCHDPNN